MLIFSVNFPNFSDSIGLVTSNSAQNNSQISRKGT